MKTTFIYGLFCENNPEEIRYVGKSDNPKKRLYRHLGITKRNIKLNKKLTHKENWIVKNNFNISYLVLEECDNNIWQDREKYWMSQHENLTNTSSGGMGGAGIIYTMTYEETKKWVKKNLTIRSKSDWYNKTKNNILPDYISRNPVEVYKNRGWVSWIDFLGTNNTYDNNVNYLTYDDAKLIIKDYELKTIVDYKNVVKNDSIPHNIPNRPERYYKNRGWLGWGDFLGSNRIANQNKEFMTYDEFKEIINSLNIKSGYEFNKKRKDIRNINEKIPSNPNIHYKNKGWVSWDLIFNKIT
jgi:hypothetical protein